MSLRMSTVLFVTLILLIPSMPISTGSGTIERSVVVPDSHRLLRLRIGDFDPLDGIPLADGLLTSGRTEYYIVQFDGPIQPSWPGALTGLGCSIIWYLPDDAYLVRSAGASQSELVALDHVRYVGPYHVGYKLSPDLYDKEAPKVVYITPIGDVPTIEKSVVELGGTILAVSQGLVRAQLPRERFVQLAKVPDVGFIEPGGGGSFLMDNDARILRARQNINGNFTNDGLSLWSWNGSAFQGITGKGIRVMVTDTGIDGTHPDFAGRMVHFNSLNSGFGNWTDYQIHGTHCAGIVLGNGTYRPYPAPQGANGTYAGIAPEALLMGQIIDWDANDDLMFGITVEDVIADTELYGAMVSSNSWSCCGVNQVYGVTSQKYDDAVRDSNTSKDGDQSIVYVFAAGNSGAGNIITPGVAKNVITVGATGDRRAGYDENYLASFSSKGPVADGRRKPDVLAPGVAVMSALANNPNFSWTALSGTSMATPGVAGASTLVIDYYNQTYGFIPSPAMVKSVLVNGADQLVNPAYKYADSNQGWGRVNLSRSLLETNGRKVWGEDQKHPLSTDQYVDYYFNVSGSKELRIHMAYTDPGAAPPVSKALVNDLDLIAFSPNGTQYNASYFVNDYSAPGGTPDSLNNVEGLRFNAPALGQWRVRVYARDVPTGPQDYALTINGWIDISLHDVNIKAAGVSFSSPSIVEGDGIQWTVGVANDALVPVGDVMYWVRLDGNAIKMGTIKQMARREIVQITGNWTATRGKHTFSLEVDPLNILKETDERDNAASASVFVDSYGLMVKVAEVGSLVRPGDAAEWVLTINNTGTLVDTYDLVHPDPTGGWSVSAPDTVQLGPGMGQAVTVRIGTPANALAGQRFVVPFTIRSQALPTLGSDAVVYAVVKETFGVALGVSPGESYVDPDGSVPYNMTMTNKGNGPDTYAISYDVSSPGSAICEAWSDTGHVQLDPGASMTVPFEVYAYKGAPASERCVVDVIVTSMGDRSVKAKGTVLAIVNARPDLVSTLDPNEAYVMPGGHSDHRLKVRNLGNGPETVLYQVIPPERWPQMPPGSSIPLAQDGTMDFMVRINAPADALAGQYKFRVLALWLDAGAQKVIKEHAILITVGPNYSTSLTVEPLKLNGTEGDAFDIHATVVNNGNSVDRVGFVFEGVSDRWGLTGGPFSAYLKPGMALTGDFHLTTVNGTAGNHTITISAVSNAASAPYQKVPLTLWAQPKPPPVEPPIIEPPIDKPNNTGMLLMVGLIIAVVVIICIVVLVLWMRKRGRRSVEQPPALVQPQYPEPPPEAPKPDAPKEPPKDPVQEEKAPPPST